MSSGWDSSAPCFFMSTSNLTLTEIMDLGFVAAAHGNSSPLQSQLEQMDSRVQPKSGVSPHFLKVSESTPLQRGAAKLWLGTEDGKSSACQSPLNPEGLFLEQSSLVSDPLTQFNNSIVGVFGGATVSTPYMKECMESSDALMVNMTTSTLHDSEGVINVAVPQKTVPPTWEISEIKYAVEENTPSLDVSISDLRFPNGSSEAEPSAPAQQFAAPPAQWVGVKHKDIGRSYLQPLCYVRHLSASEIPVTNIPPPACAFQLTAASADQP